MSLASGAFWPTMLIIVMFSFVVGQRKRSALVSDSARLSQRLIIQFVFLVLVSLSAVVIWSRYRWLALFDDSLWPRALPFPDAILLAFHDWMNAKYPSPPGHLKLHGEYYSVLLCLNVSAWFIVLVSGFYLGVFFRTGFPVGFRQWCNRILPVNRQSDVTKL
jgi:hypothetical protein